MSWYMWWVQNSYGPTFCSLPYLQEPWVTALQNAQDLWFKYQGDGKNASMLAGLVAPDGSLCDCAGPNGAIYVQGDLDWKMHDWFYEAAAAGVVMQGEILLISRDMQAIRRYLPNLKRACEFIEQRRDPTNNLFLVGAAANLLAPSYGGIRQPDGTFGKGYLAGLSVNYLAALDRMVELLKLAGDTEDLKLYLHRQKITRASLPLLRADEGYFVKAIAPDGTRHGRFGQQRYGYFEVAPNVDAVCFRAVEDHTAVRIMSNIRDIPQLRPNGFLITNYPSLDDTYLFWDDNKGIEKHDLLRYGRWVNGGVWTTMEARAVMAAGRVGYYDDVLAPARATWKLAKRFQLDAPLQDFGKNVWFTANQTNLCYDSLGVPAAVARGLFEYAYAADSLTLYPHIPRTITEYTQNEPVRFGQKRLTISLRNGGPRIASVRVNGRAVAADAPDHVVLRYDELPMQAQVEIVTAGAWPHAREDENAVFFGPDPDVPADLPTLPDVLAAQQRVLQAMHDKLAGRKDAEYARAVLSEALAAYSAYRKRAALNAAGSYPEMDPGKQSGVMAWYQDAANNLYTGFETMMERYAASEDPREREMGLAFAALRGEVKQ